MFWGEESLYGQSGLLGSGKYSFWRMATLVVHHLLFGSCFDAAATNQQCKLNLTTPTQIREKLKFIQSQRLGSISQTNK